MSLKRRSLIQFFFILSSFSLENNRKRSKIPCQETIDWYFLQKIKEPINHLSLDLRNRSFSFLSSLWTGSSGASVRPKKCEHVGHTKRKNKGRHIMLALEERKPFHKIETIVSIGSQKRPEVNARRSKGNRRRAPKVFFLIRWCWRGSLVERIENVKSWKTARSLSLNEWKGKRENV